MCLCNSQLRGLVGILVGVPPIYVRSIHPVLFFNGLQSCGSAHDVAAMTPPSRIESDSRDQAVSAPSRRVRCEFESIQW